MFSHVMLGSNDIRQSKIFYDALLEVLGAEKGIIDELGRLIYMHNESVFLLTPPIDGKPATGANGATLGFSCDSPEQVNAWHAAGVATGGEAIEEPPGTRTMPAGELYLAYLRDPSGNKLCGLYRMP
jgi:catechol 2,3-dioxygenase-like lactoylglutathione lyase family enzyme